MGGRRTLSLVASHGLFLGLLAGPPVATVLAMRRGVPEPVAIFAIITVCVVFQLVLEIVRPFRTAWNTGRDTKTDVACLAVGGATAQLLDGVVLAGVYVVASALAARSGGTLWPSTWPLLAQVTLAVLVADLAHYAIHRALHRVPALWNFHAMHHGPDHLYALNFFRMHPVDICLKTTVDLAPLIVLGASREVIAIWTVVSAVASGTLNHSNIALDTRWLDGIFSTPALHRWHHSSRPEETETNFGNITMLYDRIFGTYHAPGERSVDAVGLETSRRGLYDLLVRPLRALWAGAPAVRR